MVRVVESGIIYYEIVLGGISLIAFDPQELIIRMAVINLSLN